MQQQQLSLSLLSLLVQLTTSGTTNQQPFLLTFHAAQSAPNHLLPNCFHYSHHPPGQNGSYETSKNCVFFWQPARPNCEWWPGLIFGVGGYWGWGCTWKEHRRMIDPWIIRSKEDTLSLPLAPNSYQEFISKAPCSSGNIDKHSILCLDMSCSTAWYGDSDVSSAWDTASSLYKLLTAESLDSLTMQKRSWKWSQQQGARICRNIHKRTWEALEKMLFSCCAPFAPYLLHQSCQLLLIISGNSVFSFLLQRFQCQLWHAHTPRLTGSLRWTWTIVDKVEFHQWRSIFGLENTVNSYQLCNFYHLWWGWLGWKPRRDTLLCWFFALSTNGWTSNSALPLASLESFTTCEAPKFKGNIEDLVWCLSF